MKTTALLLGFLTTVAVGQSPTITVTVDGEAVAFPDMGPVEEKGRVLVPLRGVFEKLGATVRFENATQTVVVVRGDDTIRLTLGDEHATKNEEVLVMNAKAVLRNGRVLAPLRFLSETLNATVVWDGATRTVQIARKSVTPAPTDTGGAPPP